MKINNLAMALQVGTLSVFGGMMLASQANAHHIDLGWNSSPSSLRIDSSENLGKEYNFECIPLPSNYNLNPYSIRGTDSYTSRSRICQAAVHAGVITREGGYITFKINPGKDFYTGLSRNGLASTDSGPSDLSFSFIGGSANQSPSNEGNIVSPSQTTGSTTNSPTNTGVTATNQPSAQISEISWSTTLGKLGLDSYENQNKPMTFRCGPLPSNYNLNPYSIRGTDSYTSGSRICQAAAHAGVITRDGGNITLQLTAGQEFYTGSERYGLASTDGGSSEYSILFIGDRVAGDSPQSPASNSNSAPSGIPGAVEEGARRGVEQGVEEGVKDALRDLF